MQTNSINDFIYRNLCEINNDRLETLPLMPHFYFDYSIIAIIDLKQFNHPAQSLVLLKDQDPILVQESPNKIMKPWIKKASRFEKDLDSGFSDSDRKKAYKRPITIGNFSFTPFTTSNSSNNWLAIHYIASIDNYENATAIRINDKQSFKLDTDYKKLKKKLDYAKKESLKQYNYFYGLFSYFVSTPGLPMQIHRPQTTNGFAPLEEWFFFLDRTIFAFLDKIHEEELISDKGSHFYKKIRKRIKEEEE